MKRSAPVDTMPEFEALSIETSNLMLEAASHKAKGDLFDAAVVWFASGRKLAELASHLLQHDYAYEAAQDILHSAACFLEAGDHRPAEEQLERFSNLPQLRQILNENPYVKREFERISEWHAKQFEALDNARAEWHKQMGGPDGAVRLRERWLEQTFRKMPGVFELHWFAAEKYWIEGEGKKDKHLWCRAIEHHFWFVKLHPERVNGWLLLVARLGEMKRWAEAVQEVQQAVKLFPGLAITHFFAAGALYHLAMESKGTKRLLNETILHVDRSIDLHEQLTDGQNAAARILKAGCLVQLGRNKEAEKTLRDAMKAYPASASDVALLALQVKAPMERARVLRNSNEKLMRCVLEPALQLQVA